MGVRPALRCRRGVPARRGVNLVHRGRFGGNARKRKAKLTDDTFHTMISPAARAEAHIATIEPDAGGETVVVLAEELAVVQDPSLAQPVRAHPRMDGRRFACQD